MILKRALSAAVAVMMAVTLSSCASKEPAAYDPNDMVSRIETLSSAYEPEFPEAGSSVVLPSSDQSAEPDSSSSSSQFSSAQSSAVAPSSSSQNNAVVSSSSQSSAVASSSSSQSSAVASSSSSQSSVAASSSSSQSSSSGSSASSGGSVVVAPDDEVRGVWFSYLDLAGFFSGGTMSSFTKAVSKAFDQVAALGMNTVYVQVRPFGDAYYDSAYFPWSARISGTEGVSPGYDPLEIMVEEAHERGLLIEAWINPYRVRANGSVSSLCEENQARIWCEEGNRAAVAYNGGVYYNPGSAQARELILNGVIEIVDNYEVDGIHFDDYFYPNPDTSFDAPEYSAYQQGGGTLSLSAWRMENVNILVRDVYAAIKARDSRVRFGISPQANESNNRNCQYIDVDKWLCNSGYVDYICPQVYFGFNNASHPFSQTVSTWNSKIKSSGVELIVGVAPYKLGETDNWAGSSGKNEWVGTTDILARMIVQSRKSGNYAGFAMYSYQFLFASSSQAGAERESIREIL